MKDFDYWEKLHESEKLEEFSTDEQGFLWLKLKSIVRKELISEFVTENEIELKDTSLNGQFVELYALLARNPVKSHKLLNEYIETKNKTVLAALDTKKLVSELYKLKSFDWGGDYQNSLDKYMDVLKSVIRNYLDNFANKKVADLRIAFKYKGKPQTFTALTDVIFVVK